MKILKVSIIVLSFYTLLLFGCSENKKIIKTTPETSWWFGVVNHGHLMPLDSGYIADLYANLYGNQAQPLLLSNHGDLIWYDQPPKLTFLDE